MGGVKVDIGGTGGERDTVGGVTDLTAWDGEMDQSGDDDRPGYTWRGAGEDGGEAFDGADDMVSVRDGDIARSNSGGGSAWNVFRAVERSSSCLVRRRARSRGKIGR